MTPLWKRRKKPFQEGESSIPKSKIPIVDREPLPPKKRISESKKRRSRDDLPSPRKKSSQPPKTTLPSQSGSESRDYTDSMNSRIPKSKIPKESLPPKRAIHGSKKDKPTNELPPPRRKSFSPPKTTFPSRSGPRQEKPAEAMNSRIPKSKIPKESLPPKRAIHGSERHKAKSELPPPRETISKSSKTAVPSSSGSRTYYSREHKERGRTPPKSTKRSKHRTPKPKKSGTQREKIKKTAGSRAKKTKDSKRVDPKKKKARSPIPEELLEEDIKMISKTPQKEKIPPKSKVPKN